MAAPPPPPAGAATGAGLPDGFICPITQELLVDPVLTVGDGHTYERAAIERWLKTHNSSPMTNQPLSTRALLPNTALRRSIGAYLISSLASEEERLEYLTRRLPTIQRDEPLAVDDALGQPPFCLPARSTTSSSSTTNGSTTPPSSFSTPPQALSVVVGVLRGELAKSHPAVAAAALRAFVRVMEDAEQRLRAPWHKAWLLGATASASAPFGGGHRVQLLTPAPFATFSGFRRAAAPSPQEQEGRVAEALRLRLHALQAFDAVMKAVDRQARTDADVADIGTAVAVGLMLLVNGRAGSRIGQPRPPPLMGPGGVSDDGGNAGGAWDAWLRGRCFLLLAETIVALANHGRSVPIMPMHVLLEYRPQSNKHKMIIHEDQVHKATFEALAACLGRPFLGMSDAHTFELQQAMDALPFTLVYTSQSLQLLLAAPAIASITKALLRRSSLRDGDLGSSRASLRFLEKLTARSGFRSGLSDDQREAIISALCVNVLEPAAGSWAPTPSFIAPFASNSNGNRFGGASLGGRGFGLSFSPAPGVAIGRMGAMPSRPFYYFSAVTPRGGDGRGFGVPTRLGGSGPSSSSTLAPPVAGGFGVPRGFGFSFTPPASSSTLGPPRGNSFSFTPPAGSSALAPRGIGFTFTPAGPRSWLFASTPSQPGHVPSSQALPTSGRGFGVPTGPAGSTFTLASPSNSSFSFPSLPAPPPASSSGGFGVGLGQASPTSSALAPPTSGGGGGFTFPSPAGPSTLARRGGGLIFAPPAAPSALAPRSTGFTFSSPAGPSALPTSAGGLLSFPAPGPPSGLFASTLSTTSTSTSRRQRGMGPRAGHRSSRPQGATRSTRSVSLPTATSSTGTVASMSRPKDSSDTGRNVELQAACQIIVNLLEREERTDAHEPPLGLLWGIAARLPSDCAAANDLRRVTAERLMAHFAASVREKERNKGRTRKWRKPRAPVRPVPGPVVGQEQSAAEETDGTVAEGAEEEATPPAGAACTVS